jgi:hypothetical protein
MRIESDPDRFRARLPRRRDGPRLGSRAFAPGKLETGRRRALDPRRPRLDFVYWRRPNSGRSRSASCNACFAPHERVQTFAASAGEP